MKVRTIISLLLVLALAISPFASASAYTADETHAHEVEAVYSTSPDTQGETIVEDSTETFYDGELEWLLDEHGVLHIGGSGYVAPFASMDDQPWGGLRETITAVLFDYPNQPTYDSLDYWFDGCTNLSDDMIFDPEQSALLLLAGTYSISDCSVQRCTCADGACSKEYRNHRTAENPDQYHIMTIFCADCGRTDGIITSGSHSFSGNTCTLCGYTKVTCAHTYTSRKNITDCDWQTVCASCAAVVSSGTSHTYTYGSWSYKNASTHSRTYTCKYGDSSTYTDTASHSASVSYSSNGSSGHTVSSYCSGCGTTLSSSTASHSISTGSWSSYSASQHSRSVGCTLCSYGTTEYASHSFSYGSWSSYSDTQHRRSASCFCGYSTYDYANHSLTYGAWKSVNTTQHSRTKSCSCGYSGTETASHSWTNGAWSSAGEEQHKRTNSCTCGATSEEIGAHADANSDGNCDSCSYLMTRFSVTVPASLVLAMADSGEVFTATDAKIANNSTAAVRVTGVSVASTGGWSLVPYSHNMAAAKVNSRQIGFSINGATTAKTGTTEALNLGGGWSIAKGASLPISYDAIVSATAQPIRGEQVLTITFVVDWAV